MMWGTALTITGGWTAASNYYAHIFDSYSTRIRCMVSAAHCTSQSVVDSSSNKIFAPLIGVIVYPLFYANCKGANGIFFTWLWVLWTSLSVIVCCLLITLTCSPKRLNCEGRSWTGSAECIWKAPLAAAKRPWMIPEHSSQVRCFWLG